MCAAVAELPPVAVLGPRDEALAQAIRVGGARPLFVLSANELAEQLADGLDLVCALSSTEGFDERAAGMREDPRAALIPIVAAVLHPSEGEFLDALRAGADDAVVRGDLGAVTRRVALLASHPPRSSVARTRRALIVLADDERRRSLARALWRCGFEPIFAASPDAVRQRKDSGPVTIGVIDEKVTNDGDPAMWLREQLGAEALPIVVLTDSMQADQGGCRVAHTGWLPADAPPHNLMFVVNEMLSSRASEQRSSPRLLFATLCSFRRARDMVARFGVTYNISRDGLFVQTLDPPHVGETVWVELRAPGSHGALHLRGIVAWRRLADPMPTPPGFAVHLIPQLCPATDLDRYREAYQSFLQEPREYAVAAIDDQVGQALGELRRGRVLLADDDPDVAKSLSRVLERAGYDVSVAADGDEAVAQCRQHDFDLVVTDIHMPGKSGLDLLRALRASDEDAAVLITTGQPEVQTAIAALESGALSYLVKPVTPESLTKAAEHAVRARRLAQFRKQAARVLAEDGQAIGRDRRLSSALDRALERLFIHYQPIVSWSERRVHAFEALVRSGEPALPHPGALFDAAERLGRVAELSRRIRALAPAPISLREELLFVNLHSSDLNDDDLYRPDTPLAAVATKVVLEITERASLEGIHDLRGRIERLRELGFRIAVDDLGAGYAGLSAFCALEPDVIKLDLSLVRDIHRLPTKQRLARSMAEVARDLGITLVAEGVETADELDVLAALGCELFQGYLFARPAPPFVEVSWPGTS